MLRQLRGQRAWQGVPSRVSAAPRWTRVRTGSAKSLHPPSPHISHNGGAHPSPAPAAPAAPHAPAASPETSGEPAAAQATATNRATLLVQCPDKPGVIAALAQLLFGFGCNIVASDQFTDVLCDPPMFFQRIEMDYSQLVIGSGNTPILERAVAEVAKRWDMKWRISYRDKRKRVAVLVSKMDHCLYDLLIRFKSGELPCTIPVIISNHPDLEPVAKMFGVEFRHLPMASKEQKRQQEAAIEQVLEEFSIDTVVLARYMQIFSKEFCDKHWERTINIHHSFLPAFEGAKPYHRAHERGVKIIGATAHYATSELDAGPIIEQDITRINHLHTVEDMIRKGRDLERLVLARAIRWHLNDRIMVYGNKTVVFED